MPTPSVAFPQPTTLLLSHGKLLPINLARDSHHVNAESRIANIRTADSKNRFATAHLLQIITKTSSALQLDRCRRERPSA